MIPLYRLDIKSQREPWAKLHRTMISLNFEVVSHSSEVCNIPSPFIDTILNIASMILSIG